jgi:hypothetical protein
MREPWQRSRVRDSEIDHAQKTSRTAMMLIRTPWSYVAAVDYNEGARRAPVQVLALRVWQLRHGGQFPKSLDALVPDELLSLPSDRYSGRPFRYVRSDGQEVLPLRFAPSAAPSIVQSSTPGSWLLCSIGPDGPDDGGTTFKEKDHPSQAMDIVFATPPVEDSGASEGQDRGQDTAKDRPAPAGWPSPASSNINKEPIPRRGGLCPSSRHQSGKPSHGLGPGCGVSGLVDCHGE